MKWLINGRINGSPEELRRRMEQVVDQMLALPPERRAEAVYQLFGRSQGAYAGALNGKVLTPLLALADDLEDFTLEQIQALILDQSPVTRRLDELIPTGGLMGQPPVLPEPPQPLRDIAKLNIAQQQAFFDALLWESDRWFKELSPLVDALLAEQLDRTGWIDGLCWFIETVAKGVAEALKTQEIAHALGNEFRWEYVPRLHIENGNPDGQRERIREYAQRIRMAAAAGNKIEFTPRCAKQAQRHLKKCRPGSLVYVYQPVIPYPLELWLMESQGADELAPLFEELGRNATKSLAAIPEADRFFSTTLTRDETDPDHWWKFSVKNSYDPQQNRVKGGAGSYLISKVCRRLQAWDGSRRDPRLARPVAFEKNPDLKVYEVVIFLPRGDNAPEEGAVR